MDRNSFLAAFEESLLAITNPRYYESERGFQGALLGLLQARLPPGVVPSDAILEQEYQKRLAEHGINIRPDIIVHEPFDPARHAGRFDGNYVAVELKLRGTRAQAVEDFESLQQICTVLKYELAVFVNIGSPHTFAKDAPASLRGRAVCYAIRLDAGGSPQLVASYT